MTGNDNNKFHLHETTGVLTVKNYLDFEKESSYIIQIRAIDGGVPARSNFTQLLIGVNDVNDETPKFNNPSGYVLDIPEVLIYSYVAVHVFYELYNIIQDYM